MRASSRLSHHSPSGGGVSVNAPRIAKPSSCSAASAVSMRDVGMASSAASAAAVVGPKPSSRPRTASTSAASLLRSEEHTSELQSHHDLVCRLLLEKKNKK